eukprot:653384-Rhodomonas_salina.1
MDGMLAQQEQEQEQLKRRRERAKVRGGEKEGGHGAVILLKIVSAFCLTPLDDSVDFIHHSANIQCRGRLLADLIGTGALSQESAHWALVLVSRNGEDSLTFESILEGLRLVLASRHQARHGIRSYPQPDASDILNDNKTPIQSGKRGSTCCASFDIPPPLSVIVLCVFSTIPILVTKSTASEKHWHSALADKHAFILSPPHRAARRKSLWCHVSDEKQREEKCQVEQGGHALRDH